MDLWEEKTIIKSSVRSSSLGFTLIEVIMAIVILASALTVLLGLQASIIERTIRDSNQKQAAMFTRQILAAIESEEAAGNPLAIQNTKATIEELLVSILGGPYIFPEGVPVEDFTGILDVTYAGIPSVNPEALKRIEVTVLWSDLPQDKISVLLFIPYDEENKGEAP